MGFSNAILGKHLAFTIEVLGSKTQLNLGFPYREFEVSGVQGSDQGSGRERLTLTNRLLCQGATDLK